MGSIIFVSTLFGIMLMCFYNETVVPFTIYITLLWIGWGVITLIKHKMKGERNARR